MTCVNVTLGAINVDSVFVPSGAQCVLQGTTLNGTLQVGAAASMWASNVRVTGGLVANGATVVDLRGTSTRIGGGVQIKTGGAVRLFDAQVTGDMQIGSMSGAVTASRNRMVGNMQIMDNRGGVTMNRNSMTGVMQCKGNLPAPTGTLNTASLKEDQCLGL